MLNFYFLFVFCLINDNKMEKNSSLFFFTWSFSSTWWSNHKAIFQCWKKIPTPANQPQYSFWNGCLSWVWFGWQIEGDGKNLIIADHITHLKKPLDAFWNDLKVFKCFNWNIYRWSLFNLAKKIFVWMKFVEIDTLKDYKRFSFSRKEWLFAFFLLDANYRCEVGL